VRGAVGDWPKVLAIGRSLYAPLHQAAHGGAPLATVERLLQLEAWRTLRTARGERPLDIAIRMPREHLALLLEPRYGHHVAETVLKFELASHRSKSSGRMRSTSVQP
jgi:hypothetical protein